MLMLIRLQKVTKPSLNSLDKILHKGHKLSNTAVAPKLWNRALRNSSRTNVVQENVRNASLRGVFKFRFVYESIRQNDRSPVLQLCGYLI